ncbi:MAG TPA: type II secretion system inner membrane protein GspF [Casimicrobiaceae bacterium]|nr:type II secretion system inner membrane protein GspF [Casimicrobiaceae bacterium]
MATLPSFRWEAVDADGRTRHGVDEADSARGLRDRLRSEGLTPTAVEPARVASTAFTRLPARELALATRQLATLAQAGMTLDAALGAAAAQADDPRTAKLLAAVRGHVASGESLPAVLARFPRTFSPLYRGLVAAASESGRLPDVLARLADYLEARLALAERFTTALIYPVLVAVIALAVIAVLLVYVVPQVVSVYQQSRQTLPWLTQALIATSSFFRATAWLWLVALLALATGFSFGMRRAPFREAVHRRLLAMPGVGRLLRSLDTARFASTLAILVASGTPLLRALDAATAVIRLRPIADAATVAAAGVREGMPLARALAATRAFPPVLVHLTASGEGSGALAPMLERAAADLEREAERRLQWLAAIVQPLMIVAMGAIVLVLVLAIMLPIVSMNQLIR